jgi:hypothetical protein
MNTTDLLVDILCWVEFADEEDLLSELKDSDPDVWANYILFAEMFSKCVKKLEANDEPQYLYPSNYICTSCGNQRPPEFDLCWRDNMGNSDKAWCEICDKDTGYERREG